MLHLQVHPEFRSIAEPVSKPQRRVASYSAFAVDNLGDAIWGDEKLTGKFSWTYADGLYLACQYLTRMNGDAHLAPFAGADIRFFALGARV